MTLIINVLHKDFSVIAADRLVNANGPTTFTIGNMTVNFPNGGKIVGAYPKIVTSSDRLAAVGAAGTIAEHTFIEAFKRAVTPLEALAAVRAAAQDAFAFEDRDRFLDGTPQMINEAILSFFDEEKGAFWSFILKYTRFESHQFASARRAHPEALIFSVGSGNATMHEQVSGDDIEAFTSALADGWSESLIGDWLDTVFGRVATHNDTLSADYEAFIATRNNATFRPLRRDER